ncbi:MAG: cell division protein ZapA [Bacteroidota bacterium]
MEPTSIHINIFGRKYPVRVEPDEAPAVEEAALLINEKIRHLRTVFPTQDDLDIAIMCCLQLVSEQLRLQDDGSQALQDRLDKINRQLDLGLKLSEE